MWHRLVTSLCRFDVAEVEVTYKKPGRYYRMRQENLHGIRLGVDWLSRRFLEVLKWELD